MNTNPLTCSYKSSSFAYSEAYSRFLLRTDQKLKMAARLHTILDDGKDMSTMIDIGAADGRVTSLLSRRFMRCIAIEPNQTFSSRNVAKFPEFELIADELASVSKDLCGDLVLCAHVFFHISRSQWLDSARRMLKWRTNTGIVAIALQSRGTDSMQMLSDFGMAHEHLDEFFGELREENFSECEASLEQIPSMVWCRNLEEAIDTSEYMLNCVENTARPSRSELEKYVQNKFSHQGGYRFTCSQDLLIIQAKR